MRQGAPDSLLDALRLVLRTGLCPPRQATLPGFSVQLRSTPQSARPAARLRSGTAARRLRLRRLVCVSAEPPRGACRAALFSAVHYTVRSFLLSSWLFLQKSASVLPSLLGVSIKDAALHYVPCLARLLQTLPAHSVHARGRRLAGLELIEKRGTTRLKHRRKQNFCEAEIFRIR